MICNDADFDPAIAKGTWNEKGQDQLLRTLSLSQWEERERSKTTGGTAAAGWRFCFSEPTVRFEIGVGIEREFETDYWGLIACGRGEEPAIVCCHRNAQLA